MKIFQSKFLNIFFKKIFIIIYLIFKYSNPIKDGSICFQLGSLLDVTLLIPWLSSISLVSIICLHKKWFQFLFLGESRDEIYPFLDYTNKFKDALKFDIFMTFGVQSAVFIFIFLTSNIKFFVHRKCLSKNTLRYDFSLSDEKECVDVSYKSLPDSDLWRFRVQWQPTHKFSLPLNLSLNLELKFIGWFTNNSFQIDFNCLNWFRFDVLWVLHVGLFI